MRATGLTLLWLLCVAFPGGASGQEPRTLWRLQAEPAAAAGDERAKGSGPELRRIQGAVRPPSGSGQVTIELPDRLEQWSLREVARDRSGNLTVHGESAGHSHALLTFGGGGVFGDIRGEGGRYMVNTDASGTWLLRIDDPRMSVDTCPHLPLTDTVAIAPPFDPSRSTAQQIDVMFVYPAAMVERYPGPLLASRLSHLIAVANQSMVDSQLSSIGVRLVHHQLVADPPTPDNGATLTALREALRGEPAPPFTGLDTVRAQFGADLVVFTWPHDIDFRGSCGVAFLPDDSGGEFDASAGSQITNDGVSNWSVCSNDVFAHELGHNLGALHQRFPGQPESWAYAHVVEGRYHTLMGSFGSSHVDRFKRIPVFSNSAMSCGGVPCGSLGEANQVLVVHGFAPIVAGYQAAVVPGQSTPPSPSMPDSDGDGVSDWLDPYPFDPFDGDPPPQPPAPDFAPLTILPGSDPVQFQLLVLSSGDNKVHAFDLAGRPMGVVAAPDQVDPRPVLTEHSDLDVDGEGRLYLLASADVRRYSRENGRLLDVFLSSQQPPAPPLLSGFPRAMGFNLDRSQLVVLGDFAVERFAPDGTRLNLLGGGPSPTDPDNWNDYMTLPLRAFAFAPDDRFYLVEALQNRILAFDSSSGARLADVAGPGAGLIQDPRDLVRGADGWLYLADGASNRVLRFDPADATAAEVFISAGLGGLSFTRALAFGPEGSLYVLSRNDNRVLRYDGSSGAFLGVLIESAGLDQPEALRITPMLDLIFRDGLESP